MHTQPDAVATDAPSARPGSVVDRYTRRAEPLVFVLAAASLPLLLLEDAWPVARWAGWLIVVLFAADLAVRVTLAPAPRGRYLRSNWLDVLIVVLSLLPLLRPLRMLRAFQLLRFTRFGMWAVKGWNTARIIWGELRGKTLLVVGGIGAAAALGVVYLSERAAPDSSIHSAETTLWWAVTTVTTVGYGDTSPVTVEGRIAAAVLMLVGISMFGVVTANVSARFVRQDALVRPNSTKFTATGALHCPSCGTPIGASAPDTGLSGDGTSRITSAG